MMCNDIVYAHPHIIPHHLSQTPPIPNHGREQRINLPHENTENQFSETVDGQNLAPPLLRPLATPNLNIEPPATPILNIESSMDCSVDCVRSTQRNINVKDGGFKGG